MANKVKSIFLRNGAGAGYSYHKNDVAELPEEAFKDLKTLKYVRAYDPEKDAPQDEGTDLPMDLPGRDSLILAEITTIEDVKSIEDLTEIKGIGPKLSEQIKEYFNK